MLQIAPLDRKIVIPEWVRIGIILCFVFVFLIAIELLAESLELLSENYLHDIILAISNPFVGLFIGLLVSALLQSSSAVTSLTVVFVASGTLTLPHAIPVVIGANIGTTITCIIVAFGHITSKKEFKRAITVALTHNLFNISSALILFPLEYFTNILSKIASYLSHFLIVELNLGKIIWIDLTVAPISKWLYYWLSDFYFLLPLGFAIVLLLFSIRAFTQLSKQVVSPNETKLETIIFGTPLKALFSGILITAAIRSSSATTSLVIPLAAANRLSVINAFHFIMGANLGTTVTALLAALSKSEVALSIALVHLLFNVFGISLFTLIAPLRNLLIASARTLGRWSFEHRLIGFLYLLFVFFLLPFFLILLTK